MFYSQTLLKFLNFEYTYYVSNKLTEDKDHLMLKNKVIDREETLYSYYIYAGIFGSQLLLESFNFECMCETS